MLRVALALLGRPSLWVTAVAATLRLAQPGWWRRFPPVPLPAPEYLHFRLETQYGGSGLEAAEPGDVIAYLDWYRQNR